MFNRSNSYTITIPSSHSNNWKTLLADNQRQRQVECTLAFVVLNGRCVTCQPHPPELAPPPLRAFSAYQTLEVVHKSPCPRSMVWTMCLTMSSLHVIPAQYSTFHTPVETVGWYARKVSLVGHLSGARIRWYYIQILMWVDPCSYQASSSYSPSPMPRICIAWPYWSYLICSIVDVQRWRKANKTPFLYADSSSTRHLALLMQE